MIPQTTELSQIQAAFIDKDNRIEELMRQINSAQSLLNSLKEPMNSLVGDGKITIKTYAGSNVGDFTVNQKEDKTITLPQQATVNNGKLTITRNGTYIAEFTANQSGDTPVDITVPTKTSDLTNDISILTSSSTAANVQNKTAAKPLGFTGEIGSIIACIMSSSNTHAEPTLTLTGGGSDFGPYPIMARNSPGSGVASSVFAQWKAGQILYMIYSTFNNSGAWTVINFATPEYTNSNLYETINATIDLTGTSQNNMVSIDMNADNDTIYDIIIRGALNNANLNGSAMVRAFTRSGFVNQHNIPIWYSSGNIWYNVTVNFAGTKVRFFSTNLQQSLYVTVIKHLL